MIKSLFQAKCLLAAVVASLLMVDPALADKPSWAGNSPGGHGRQNDRGHDKRDFSDRERRDRDYDRQYRDNRKRDHADRRDGPRYDDRNRPRYGGGRYFADNHRTIIHNYYYDNYRGRRCPPGLAKKGNGCVPPGHARRWVIGRPLPRNVIFYDVPQPVLLGLGYPPPGYRFVRVASDILMIAIGSGMVMDAIYDLGGGW
jgi:Ni/Co efflux regulator RcnB